MKQTLKVISLLLILSTLFSFSAFAADSVMPCSSSYLNNYTTNLSLYSGTTKLQIAFSVTGVKVLDEIGAKRIELQRSTNKTSWSTIKTFLPSQYPRMLGENKNFYASYVDYTATTGYYYRAYITIWGGKDGDGDYRYVYTNVIDLKGTNP